MACAADLQVLWPNAEHLHLALRGDDLPADEGLAALPNLSANERLLQVGAESLDLCDTATLALGFNLGGLLVSARPGSGHDLLGGADRERQLGLGRRRALLVDVDVRLLGS
jgi:hypothetical protein